MGMVCLLDLIRWSNTMNLLKGHRAWILAVLVPILFAQVIPEPLRWIWLTLVALWALKCLGVIKIDFFTKSQSDDTQSSSNSGDTPGSSKPGDSQRAGSAHRGEIVALGSAPFKFNEANSLNYYITLRSGCGDDRTLWGVDLKRVAQQTPLAVGDSVALKYLGREAVVVDKPVRNDQGKVVDYRKVNSHRNTWSATVLPA